jgi:predicted DNA-binding transcriptional regulator AlpA
MQKYKESSPTIEAAFRGAFAEGPTGDVREDTRDGNGINLRRGSPATLLLTEAKVADLLAVSPRTLQMWRYKGGGPRYLKIGSAVRYRLSDVDAWLARQTRASTADPGPDSEQ